MKKLLSVILVGLMVLSLAACGGNIESGTSSDVSGTEEAPKGEKLNMVTEAKGMEEGTVYSADIYYVPSETVGQTSEIHPPRLYSDYGGLWLAALRVHGFCLRYGVSGHHVRLRPCHRIHRRGRCL